MSLKKSIAQAAVPCPSRRPDSESHEKPTTVYLFFHHPKGAVCHTFFPIDIPNILQLDGWTALLFEERFSFTEIIHKVVNDTLYGLKRGGDDGELAKLALFTKEDKYNHLNKALARTDHSGTTLTLKDEIVKTIESDPSLPNIEVVQKCYGPQRHSHVFGYGGGIKIKSFDDSQAAYIKQLEAKLHEKEEENCNLKICIDGIENRLAQIENNGFDQPPSVAPPTSSNDLDQDA